MSDSNFLKNISFSQLTVFLSVQVFIFCFFYGIIYLNYYDQNATIFFSIPEYVSAFVSALFDPSILFYILFFIVIILLNDHSNFKGIPIIRLLWILSILLLFILEFLDFKIYPNNDLIYVITSYSYLLTASLIVLDLLYFLFSKTLFLSLFVTCIVISLSFILATKNYRSDDLNPDHTVSYNEVKEQDLKLLANSNTFFVFYDKKNKRSFGVSARDIKSISKYDNTLLRSQFYNKRHKLDADIEVFKAQQNKLTAEINTACKKVQNIEILKKNPNPTLSEKNSVPRLAQLKETLTDILKRHKELNKIQAELEDREAKLALRAKKLNIKYDKKPLPKLTLPDLTLPNIF